MSDWLRESNPQEVQTPICTASIIEILTVNCSNWQ